MKSKLLLFFVLVCCAVQAQEVRRELKGKVAAEDGRVGVSGVFVINTVAGTETKTDSEGEFSLLVKVGDRIAVYGKNIKVRNFTVNALWFQEQPFILAVADEGTQLKEVVINDTLSAASLGIVPRGQKHYTQMERKMYATGDFRAKDLLKILYGGMPFDPLINKISGRTRQVKQELATERKAAAADRLGNTYSQQMLIEELKIPEEYVEGFMFYAVEDKELADALARKNFELARFLLVGIAEKYRTLLAEKK